ncbi:unnamed protein product [Spirodela intermedia]|uniref:Protein kinase domain-containing protein n=1 Tax=Spirodela intermedia TaxID=51605 RepID=A0A7I8J3S9_SPIIN|nr:unnamed protein product [Spirodela intermedia]CAA6664906.1 unnamed protein product [Spirodela intermedia]
MERKEANPPPPVARSRPLSVRPLLSTGEPNLTGSTSSSSSSLSPPDFLRHVQAALKRHRPHGMHPNGLRARRVLVSSGRAPTNSMSSTLSSTLINLTSSDEGKSDQPLGGEVEVSPPPLENAPSSSMLQMFPDQKGSFPIRVEGETQLVPDRPKASSMSHVAAKKVHCSLAGDEVTTDNRRSSGSVLDPDLNQHNFQQMEMSGISMKMGERTEARNCQHIVDPMTQGSVTGSSATAFSLHSGQAFQCTRVTVAGQSAAPTQMSSCAFKNEFKAPENVAPAGGGMLFEESNKLEKQAKDPSFDDGIHGQVTTGDGSILQSQAPARKVSALDVVEPSQPTKSEKTSRKKRYDADSFFKVNGKLYQKLGKIGSGGSSEVYKVITSDCTIYALKKITLKGRDYPTAYGFCQEIEYLKNLRGKSNIIQLIDFEVTDKTLLEEVMTRCTNAKNGRIKDDVYIYMVLEYGEIDLAHMLSLKWKDFDRSNWKMDENWLRFYWQQMLEAVNTIHEERIVHSDLKPANFLLVRGSLKLIDFGIAKAISSDTTNIQRDSQVGTLNYMSPEAYMCNEHDADGNTIKCGRPSDIWSLGCILYQMVYGKTPFADYKTVWAKYKVVTDRSHRIVYEPVSNPWLIDLMKKCLAWDRNERWRIPQLLQHPFLLPPIPREMDLNHGMPGNR